MTPEEERWRWWYGDDVWWDDAVDAQEPPSERITERDVAPWDRE